VEAKVIAETLERLGLSSHSMAINAHKTIVALVKELVLIREAAMDPSLSDAAARAVALGTEPPTADDIAWAQEVLREHDIHGE